MKKPVFGSLLLAALASQTTGCIITTDEGDVATISADWSFHSVDANGALSPLPCPGGFETVALHNQPVDASLLPIGDKTVDLFDCIDMSHASAGLEPGVYESFVSVTSRGGGSIYADSLSAIVDVTVSDKTFSADIVDNGGYFKVAWNLTDEVTDAPLDCADVATLDGVEIASTIAGGTDAVTGCSGTRRPLSSLRAPRSWSRIRSGSRTCGTSSAEPSII